MNAAEAEATISAWARTVEVAIESGGRPGESLVILPGEAKQKSTVSLLVSERALSASVFVVRHPDENREAFFRWLLARNLRLPGVAFGVDQHDDVFLVARLPLAAISIDTLDELMGALLTAADESFNELLALGFSASISREWVWRLSRGESTANLAAFEHLRPANEE
jgi:hypothetical protein